MPIIQEIEPALHPESRPVADQARPGRSIRHGVVPCNRCRTPLPYLIERTNYRVLLSCSRCGTQTPMPTFGTRLLRAATIVFGIAATAIVAYAMTHQSPPQAPEELRELTLGAPGEWLPR